MNTKLVFFAIAIHGMMALASLGEAKSIDLRLHRAAAEGDSQLVDKLIKEAGTINVLDSEKYPAFYYALDNENEKIGLKLLKATDLNLRFGPGGDTALVMVIQKNCLECVRWVLQKKPSDVNVAARDSFTPLMIASKNSTVAIVEELLKAGADLKVKNSFGKSALDLAVKAQNHDVVKVLKKKLPK